MGLFRKFKIWVISKTIEDNYDIIGLFKKDIKETKNATKLYNFCTAIAWFDLALMDYNIRKCIFESKIDLLKMCIESDMHKISMLQYLEKQENELKILEARIG